MPVETKSRIGVLVPERSSLTPFERELKRFRTHGFANFRIDLSGIPPKISLDPFRERNVPPPEYAWLTTNNWTFIKLRIISGKRELPPKIFRIIEKGVDNDNMVTAIKLDDTTREIKVAIIYPKHTGSGIFYAELVTTSSTPKSPKSST